MNTRNKKKLRRQARLLSGSFAGKTLLTVAMVGMLAAPAMAATAAPIAPWDQATVTINSAVNKNVPVMGMIADVEGEGAQNINTTVLNITTGGDLLLTNGARLAHYNYSSTATPTIVGMAVNMDGGTLTITNGNGFSSIDANTMKISGGTVALTGTANATSWQQAAYIGAYKGMDISGTAKITMNANSELFAGNHLSITGGEIAMLGDSTATTFDAKAAHIMFAGSGNNTIGGTAKITVGDGSTAAYGVMTAPVLNMNGGTLAVAAKGNLLLQPNTGDAGAMISSGAESGVFNLSSGAVTVAADGALYAPYTQINQTGGTLTVNGTLWGNKPDLSTDYEKSGFHISGGKLVIKGDGSANASGSSGQRNGDMQVGNLSISGGEVEIAYTGTPAYTGGWADGPRLGGYGVGNNGVTAISGGTVTLGDNGVLFAGTEGAMDPNPGPITFGNLNLSGNAKIVMNGTDSVLYAASKPTDPNDGTFGHVKLNISGNADITVNAGKTGYIVSRETSMSGGSINVGAGSTLTVAGGAAKNDGSSTDYNIANGITNTSSKGGAFTLTGGAINVADAGKLDFRTGEVDVLLSGGSIAYKGGANGQLAFNGLTVAGGALNGVTDLTVAASATNSGVSTGSLTVGDAKAGSLALTTLTQTGGAVLVNNGSLTVDTLNQSASLITVGGGAGNATLKVNTALTNAAYVASSSGIMVGNLGTLEAGKSVLFDNTFTQNASVNAFMVNAGGTLKVTGLGAEINATTDLNKLKALLATNSTGLLDVGSTVITGLVKTDGTVALTDAKGLSSDQLKTATGTGTMADINTGVSGAFKGIKATDASTAGQMLTASGTLQLAGSTAGGVLAQDKDGKALNVAVADGSVLTLGDAGKANHGSVGTVALGTTTGGTLNAVGNGSASFTTGDITTGTDNTGELNVAGATLNAGKIGTDLLAVGNVAANGGALNATSIDAMTMTIDNRSQVKTGALTIGDGTTGSNAAVSNVAAGSAIYADKLTLTGTGAVLNVGSAEGAGTLIASNTSLNGGSIFYDPAFIAAGDTSNASTGAMTFTSSSIDGKVTVGQNSMVTIGTTDASWLTNQVQELQKKGSILWGSDVTAALALKGNQTLHATNGGLLVDGSYTHGGTGAVVTDAKFADKSLTMVDASTLGTGAALSAGVNTQNAIINDGAKLVMANANNGTFTILSDFGGTVGIEGADGVAYVPATNTGWNGSNLFSTSHLQTVSLVNGNGELAAGDFVVSVAQKSAQSVIPRLSGGMAQLVDSLYAQRLYDTNAANAGQRFVSRATDWRYTNVNDSASVLESAAQMALVGGAPVAAFDAVAASGSAMAERTGISMPAVSRGAGISSGDGGYTFGLWATPLYRSSEISKQKAGSFKYSVDSDLFGGIIGADVTNPLMGGDLRVGAALNVGGGDAKSRGGLAKTKNDFDFWGASIYAGYRLNNFGLSADLGYTSTSSDIKQDLLPSLQMGSQLKSKVDSDTYTVGLKAEYVINTAMVDITPSVGMRYTAYRQGRYNAESQFGTVFNMDKSEMNTWTFPVGVKFSRDLDLSGWKVTPELNLAVIPATGDTKLKSKAHLPGLAVTPASMTGHVFDSFTGEAGVGVKLAKDNLSFGLNYDFQGGSHVKAHNVFGSFRYTF